MPNSIIDQIQEWYDAKSKLLDNLAYHGPIPGMVYRINDFGEYVTKHEFHQVLPSEHERNLYRTIAMYDGIVDNMFDNEFFHEDPEWDVMYYTEFDDLDEFDPDELETLRKIYPSQFNDDGSAKID